MQFRVLLELSFGRVVLFELGQDAAIEENRARKIGHQCERLSRFVMGSRERVFLVFLQALAHEHRRELIMRERDGLVALGFGDALFRGQFGGLPVAQFRAIFDHFFLAGAAMPVVLLVGLFETIQRGLIIALMQILVGFLVGLLGFFVSGCVGEVLRKGYKREAGEHESGDHETHPGPPGYTSTLTTAVDITWVGRRQANRTVDAPTITSTELTREGRRIRLRG